MKPADWLLPLLIVAVFYLLILRPAKSRQRAALEMQAALAPGQDVITASGLHAQVVALEDDEVVVLRIAPGLETRWARGAVAAIVSPLDSAEAETATESERADASAPVVDRPTTATS